MTINTNKNMIFASQGTVFVNGIRVFISIHEQSAYDFFALFNG